MADDRTTVTELATALGTLPYASLTSALRARPGELDIGAGHWDLLAALHRNGAYPAEFATAYENGRVFAAAGEALRGRPPRLVEWTGGRRPPGDEVAPIDLRIDHVYLVSCKYLSKNVANASPARVFEGRLATSGDWTRGDWYGLVAPDEHRALYRAALAATGLGDLPGDPDGLSAGDRARVRDALRPRAWPDAETAAAYEALCRRVSTVSADRWRRGLATPGQRELLLWRLLRIGNASYFLLGADQQRSLRLRVGSSWDWRRSFKLASFEIEAAGVGQPQVDWRAGVVETGTGMRREVAGHVEVRWSHGRFSGPPEAKVYLDTASGELPGYFPLEQREHQPGLW